MTDYAEAVTEIDYTLSNGYRLTAEALAGMATAYALLDVADAIRSTKETK